MIGNWSFLKSRRFWALVLIAIIKVLDSEGIIPGVWTEALVTVLVGFVSIRTIDRFGEKASGR